MGRGASRREKAGRPGRDCAGRRDMTALSADSREPTVSLCVDGFILTVARFRSDLSTANR
jgi:hypothetical protein